VWRALAAKKGRLLEEFKLGRDLWRLASRLAISCITDSSQPSSDKTTRSLFMAATCDLQRKIFAAKGQLLRRLTTIVERHEPLTLWEAKT